MKNFTPEEITKVLQPVLGELEIEDKSNCLHISGANPDYNGSFMLSLFEGDTGIRAYLYRKNETRSTRVESITDIEEALGEALRPNNLDKVRSLLGLKAQE